MDIIAETDRQLAKQGIALWVVAIPTRALVKAQRTAWSDWAAVGKLHRTVSEAVDVHHRHGAA